jgi:hypothetical protein
MNRAAAQNGDKAMANATINYYVFDRIVDEGIGCYWGYKGDSFCEVFPLSAEDSEEELIAEGYAKCDAPGTETFIVSEADYAAL